MYGVLCMMSGYDVLAGYDDVVDDDVCLFMVYLVR